MLNSIDKRKCPLSLAKEYKLNTVKKGLDGKMWIVKKRSNNVKVWKRKVDEKTNKKKGGSNHMAKYNINYSRFNNINVNKNLENVFNSGTLISGKNNVHKKLENVFNSGTLIPGKNNDNDNDYSKLNILLKLLNKNNRGFESLKHMTSFELKNVMYSSKRIYNKILPNLVYIMYNLKNSDDLYEVIADLFITQNDSRNKPLLYNFYKNFFKLMNHINNENIDVIRNIVLKLNQKEIKISNKSIKDNIQNILKKINKINFDKLNKNIPYGPNIIFNIFIYASNNSLLKYGIALIPEGTERVSSNLLKGIQDHKPSIKEVILPNTVKKISDKTFYCCFDLESIQIDRVTHINKSAFFNCRNLTNINFQESLEYINDYAFYSCYKLNSIDLIKCNKLKKIGNDSFYNCINVVTIKFPNTNFKFETLSSSHLPSLRNIVLYERFLYDLFKNKNEDLNIRKMFEEYMIDTFINKILPFNNFSDLHITILNDQNEEIYFT